MDERSLWSGRGKRIFLFRGDCQITLPMYISRLMSWTNLTRSLICRDENVIQYTFYRSSRQDQKLTFLNRPLLVRARRGRPRDEQSEQ